MASSINLDALGASLEKRFKRLLPETAQRKAQALKTLLSDTVAEWRKDIRKDMLVNATNRGYMDNSKRLNPHDSYSDNNGWPMRVTGQLAKAIWGKITVINTPLGANVVISSGFHKVTHKGDSTSADYGEILNEGGKNYSNAPLSGFKERASAILRRRILSDARKKGF